MIAKPENVAAPGEFADDVAALVGLGVDAEAAQAMTDAADLLAERTAKHTAELLAELLAAGMTSSTLGEVAREALEQQGAHPWVSQWHLLYAGHAGDLRMTSRAYHDRLELELEANGYRCWNATLRLPG